MIKIKTAGDLLTASAEGKGGGRIKLTEITETFFFLARSPIFPKGRKRKIKQRLGTGYVWKASENMGCDLRRRNFSVLCSLFN